jgi:hypothetical protein
MSAGRRYDGPKAERRRDEHDACSHGTFPKTLSRPPSAKRESRQDFTRSWRGALRRGARPSKGNVFRKILRSSGRHAMALSAVRNKSVIEHPRVASDYSPEAFTVMLARSSPTRAFPQASPQALRKARRSALQRARGGARASRYRSYPKTLYPRTGQTRDDVPTLCMQRKAWRP